MKHQNAFEISLYDNAIFDDELVIAINELQQQRNTPMELQYSDIKANYTQDILLFQKGNFYLAFNDDAKIIKTYTGVQWKEPEYSIGLHEVSVADHIKELVLLPKINKKVVVCEQSSYLRNEQKLLLREVTGIYSCGLIGFGILGATNFSKKFDMEFNYLVSLYREKAIVIDTISKTAYWTTKSDLANIQISEIITNENYKTAAFINKAIGNNEFEQLQNYFNQRKIDGLKQITFVDEYSQNQTNFCFYYNLHDPLLIRNQLIYKEIIKPITPEGKRKLLMLFRKTPINDIISRQQIVQDLSQHKEFVQSFQEAIINFGSMQYQLACVLNGNKNQKMLKIFLEKIKLILQYLKLRIYKYKTSFSSYYLQSLYEFQDDILKMILNQFTWAGLENDQVVPSEHSKQKKSYDELQEQIQQIIFDSKQEYYRIKKYFPDLQLISFKEFVVELPSYIQVPNEMQFYGQRKGYKSYQTEKLQQLFQLYIQINEKLQIFLKLFYQDIIKDILDNKQYFDGIINQMSELDMYIAMSVYLQNDPHSCFPLIDEVQKIEINDFKHPLIDECQLNSVIVSKCMIITGCHGYGKSTLLRSIGIIILLAQIGCRVPCKSMIFKPFNSIHCRMGAYDRIDASTFELEMRDVQEMMGKQNSLLLIDEFGRGTSSIDGHSLAWATLKYLLKQNSIILFTTHFDIDLHQPIYFMDKFCLKKGQQINNLTYPYFELNSQEC